MADQLVSMLTATQFCLEVELLNYILFQENCRQFFFFFGWDVIYRFCFSLNYYFPLFVSHARVEKK